MRPFIALDPRRCRARRATCRCSAGSPSSSRSCAFARRLVGEGARRAGGVRAGRLAAAHPGVDDRRQRGAVSPALGRRARAAAGARWRRGALRHLRRRRACSPRWRRSRATTPGWRCRSSLRGRVVFARGAAAGARRRARGLAVFARWPRRCPSPGWPGARAAGDDPLFFATTSRSDHAQLAATALARYGAALGARAPARHLGAGLRRGDDAAAGSAGRAGAAGAVAGARARAPVDGASVVVVAALAPPALYLAQGLVRLELRAAAALRAGARARCCCRSRRRPLPTARLRAARVGVPLLGASRFAVVVLAGRRPWAARASGPAPSRWARSPASTARTARWPRYLRARRRPASAS